jgi:3' terminal RNA ribose 2'-O-methyltransferase Hen1
MPDETGPPFPILKNVLLTIGSEISGNDLGYLLHKNPARIHTVELPFGSAHVFYPELGEQRSQAALLLDVDPIGLVRNRSEAFAPSLRQYVNDRPYAASSFLSVALSRVLGTAMSGRSKERQELAEEPLFWDATVTAVPCRGDAGLLNRLFEPLGYAVEAKHYHLDDQFPEWGAGPYHTIRMSQKIRLKQLLTHVYVLLPVMDNDKHYWIGDEEVEKLLRKGEGWLTSHPERDLIVARYLKHDRRLSRAALARLTEEEADPDEKESEHAGQEQRIEGPTRLWEQRMDAVLSVLRSREVHSVLDLGCGEGKLLKLLLEDRRFTKITGMDVSLRALDAARRKLRYEQMPSTQKSRIDLIHGSLMYRDKRLDGFDAATAIEVIEHFDPPRLASFERVLFKCARPRVVVVTTPNSEYNHIFGTLPAGAFRHKDHRFEWSRSEFQGWCHRIAAQFGYRVEFLSVGSLDSIAGPPTQMGIFER